MLFSKFSEYLERLEKTASRLEITAILKELFEETTKDEIKEVVYLSLGILAPNYESILLNLAEKMMIKTISLAYETSQEEVIKIYKKNGDLGNTAQELNKNKDGNLTINDVFQKLLEIAKISGEGSVDQKINLMSSLLKILIHFLRVLLQGYL